MSNSAAATSATNGKTPEQFAAEFDEQATAFRAEAKTLRKTAQLQVEDLLKEADQKEEAANRLKAAARALR